MPGQRLRVTDKLTRRLSAVSILTLSLAAPAAACPVVGSNAVRCEINLARSAHGLGALRPDKRLDRAAGTHARDMVRRRYFSHTSPEGATMLDRVRRSGYLDRTSDSWAVGEMLGWGTGALGTPAAIVTAWMQSPRHRQILLGPRYRDLGVAVLAGTPKGSAGATYAAELGSLTR
jgi:uncharacterized protein YkwD